MIHKSYLMVAICNSKEQAKRDAQVAIYHLRRGTLLDVPPNEPIMTDV